MKKVIIILAAALVGLSANAKDWASNITVHAGYNANLESLKIKDEGALSKWNGTTNGIYVGAEYTAEKIFGSPIDIIAGVDYSFAAGNGAIAKPFNDIANIFGSDEVKVSEIMNDLYIPVRVGYSYDFGAVKAFAFAGPKFGIGLSYDVKTVANGHSEKDNVYNDGNEIGTFGSRFQMYLGAGVGVQFLEHFKVTFSYDGGLLNRVKGEEDREYAKFNNPGQICLGVGYCF